MTVRTNHFATTFLATAGLLWICCVAPVLAEDLEMLEQQAFRAAVDRVAPSVVRIETVGGMQRMDKVLFGDGPTTGLVVDPDGYIVSSAFNFVNRPTSILVRLGEDDMRPAKLVATDHSRMLVLLKIEVDEPLPVPQTAPIEGMRIGQWAIAVGRAFESEQPAVAVGILSATGRIWGKAIQTDAAVSPNNYGGPLIDLRGRVLGVLVPLSPQATGAVAGIEWYDSGIGFAIPGEHVIDVLPRLKAGEDLHPGILGIALAGKNPAIAEARITACRPYSPAAEAGLTVDDRIVEIDGEPIHNAAGVKAQLNRRYAGAAIELVVMRDNKRLKFSVELAKKLPPYRHPLVGILPMREQAAKSGVDVRYVYAASPAADAGIVAGDRLLSLEGKPIKNAAELRSRIGMFQIDHQVKILIHHKGKKQTVKLRLASLPEDIPEGPLPPARTTTPDQAAAEAKPAKAGQFLLEPQGLNAKTPIYVPEAYDPAVPHGLVLWLHGSDGPDFGELLGKWKTHCDRDNLILVAPQSNERRGWGPDDEVPVARLLAEIRKTHKVDPTRVVALGYGRGGTMAFALAWNAGNGVGAVVSIDGPFVGDPPELSPARRLAAYIGRSKNSRYAELISKGIEAMRRNKIPVTLRDSKDVDVDEIVRWIDTLDRI